MYIRNRFEDNCILPKFIFLKIFYLKLHFHKPNDFMKNFSFLFLISEKSWSTKIKKLNGPNI